MDLAVVVVNWNSGPCLRSLLESLSPLQNELKATLVVDNASEDGSLLCARNAAGIQIVRFERNEGFARAANEGIARAGVDFVLLVNPDVEVNAGSVRRLYSRILERPRAAIVCGPLVDRAGRSQNFQLRPLPTLSNVLSDVLFLDEIAGWARRGRVKDARVEACSNSSPGSPSGLEVEQPAAAFWLLRRQAWEEVGGFDSTFYPAWFEDVDFCKRLREKGWQILYFPHCPVFHQGGLALRRLGYRAFVGIYYGNLLKYMRKHHPRSYPLIWLPVRLGVWVRKRVIVK